VKDKKIIIRTLIKFISGFSILLFRVFINSVYLMTVELEPLFYNQLRYKFFLKTYDKISCLYIIHLFFAI
jgi:hypothetical protein